jgi:hypothetical protein
MGLLRVSMAQGMAGDPGRFRLPRFARKISIRNLRAGIRGLAPYASFIPGGGWVSQLAGMAGDKPGAKGGTHAHPSKHGTKHPHAKPSHAHARVAHGGGGSMKKIGAAIGGMTGGLGGAIDAAMRQTGGLGGAIPQIDLGHLHGMGGHRRKMNYMNIKAARRAGRRVSGAIRLLHTLEKSLPHVRSHGHVTHPKRKRR